jgi:very-short-patch-repair endonuclease
VSRPLGYKHAEVTKQKISMGNKGKKRTPAMIRRMIAVNKGRKASEETRAKLSAMRRGKPKWWASMKGKKLSAEARAKISASNRKRIYSEATKLKIKLSALSRRDYYVTAMRKRRNSPGFEKLLHKARLARPNKLESQVQAFLDAHRPGLWRYNPGNLIIDRLVPDFVNTKKRFVLEVFGDYWHRGENPAVRIQRYKKHGYRCVVVWENDFRRNPAIILAHV